MPDVACVGLETVVDVEQRPVIADCCLRCRESRFADVLAIDPPLRIADQPSAEGRNASAYLSARAAARPKSNSSFGRENF